MYKEQIEKAKQSGSMVCPICGEELYSSMDKLSILIYGECLNHLNDLKSGNILKMANFL